MTDQKILKNPFEDQIVKEVAESVAKEMVAEIQDEVAVWVEKLPITSSKVRSTDVTRAFQERFAQQLAERQEQIAEQIVLRRKRDLLGVPNGNVQRAILAKEVKTLVVEEQEFLAHVLRCALLASRIALAKAAFEKLDGVIVTSVDREMETVLREDRERWMEMGKVSETEFEKEWEEKFGGAR